MQPDNQQEGWKFRQEESLSNEAEGGTNYNTPDISFDLDDSLEDTSITWTASEFIAHQKTAAWYGAIVGGGAILAAAVFLLTRDWISSLAILVVLILFMVIGTHKPRQVSYTLDFHGLSVGTKFYPYNQFKSFAIIQEGAFSSINLMPLKRFMPEISIYYEPADESRIIEVLANSLPNDQRAERTTDRLMKRIRF